MEIILPRKCLSRDFPILSTYVNKTKQNEEKFGKIAMKNWKNFSVLQDSEELETLSEEFQRDKSRINASLFGGKEKDQNQNSEMLCKMITARRLFPNVLYFILLSDFTFRVPADVLKLKETESRSHGKTRRRHPILNSRFRFIF